MEQLEKVEKIREKTGVTYEEAKMALEKSGGDVLDALVWLEQQGKVKAPEVSVYTTEQQTGGSEKVKEAVKTYEESTQQSFGDILRKVWSWCRKMIRKSCENDFIVSKDGREIVSMPVLVMAILLIAFAITLPLMIVGLFLGFKYSFRGSFAKNDVVDVNGVCEKVSEVAENIKSEFSK